MADVTEVIHKISYEVNDDALINATKAIHAQIAELEQLGKQLDAYSKQLDKLSSSQGKQFDELNRKIDTLNKKVSTSAGKLQGAMEEVFKGIAEGITGSDGLKDAVAKYVADVAIQFKSLQKAGKETSVGFASHMKSAASAGKTASGSLVKSIGNLGKSMLGSVNVTGLAVNALIYFGEELLKEGGILDEFIGKQKRSVSETEKIIKKYSDITSESAKLASQELANSKILYETATDVTQSYSSRLEAVGKLQDQYPAYFGNLSKEAILAGKAAGKYEELTQAILAKAAAEVYTEELKELIEVEQALDKEEENAREASKFALIVTAGLDENNEDEARIKSNLQREEDFKLQLKIRDIEIRRKQNAKEQESILDKIINKQKIFNKLNASGDKKTNCKCDDKKQLEFKGDKNQEKDKREEPLVPLKLRNQQDIEVDLSPRTFEQVEEPEIENELLERLEKRRKILASIKEGYQIMAEAAVEAYSKIAQAQIKALDKEISIREKRVEEARKLAEKGNTEALRMEEERLEQAQRKREQIAKREAAVNAALALSNSLVAVTGAIANAVKGDPYSIAVRVGSAIAAVLAALAAGYTFVQSFSSSNNAFADGVVDYKGAGGPRDDKNWVRISSGESVITADGTKRNRTLLEAINKGAAFQMMDASLPMFSPAFAQPAVINNRYATAYEMKGLERKLDSVVDAIEGNRLKQNIFFNEQGVGIMTEKAINRNRKRWM